MKKLVSLVLALTLVLGLCSFASAEGAAKKVGIAMPTQSLERWNRDGAYLDEQFKAAGYETVLSFSNNDNDQQVKDLENMLSADVDLLIISCIDDAGLNTVLDQAAEKGIPVIAYDRMISNDAVSYYVSFDNYTVGVLQGTYVKEALDLANAGDKTFNMEFTGGAPTDPNAFYFFNGAYDQLKEYIEAGTIKVPSGQTTMEQVGTEQWSTDIALSRAQNILGSYYADDTVLDAWLCSNDSTAAGVAQAIETDYKGSNAVIVTGQDGDIANLKNIVDGKQTMTVYKNVANEAVVTLSVAKAILAGETIDGEALAAAQEIPCAFNTTDYFSSPEKNTPAFLLVPTVVTKDNLEYLVETGLYKWDADQKYLEAVQ
jgi:putative multiple sugar transport system substrate-binding protein